MASRSTSRTVRPVRAPPDDPEASKANPVQDLDLELDLDELINLELDLVSNLILY